MLHQIKEPAPWDALTIYVSGPMSGMLHHNFPAFHSAAKMLRDLGHTVINPAELNPEPGKPWVECMKVDIKELMCCDTVVCLPGWQHSKGASLEVYIGKALGMNIMLIEDFYPATNTLDL